MALAAKNLLANAGGTGGVGSIPGSGKSPGVRSGSPLQYPCLKNSMDRGVWRTVVRGVAKSWTQLNTHTHKHTHTPRSMCIWKTFRGGRRSRQKFTWETRRVFAIEI